MKYTLITGSICLGLAVSVSGSAQTLEQSLFSPDFSLGYKYGTALEVDGNTMVVSDLGAMSPGGLSCGSIDDGAVYIYTRSSANAPWPSVPTQTLLSNARESHFGEHISLHGNVLLVAEPRATGTSLQDGAFHYYRRANESSPFQLVDTAYRPSDAEGPMFTIPGFASNGRFVVGVTYGTEPNTRVYKLTENEIVPVYDITRNTEAWLSQADQLALTDNDVLVVARNQSDVVELYELGDSGYTVIDSSALTLSDDASQTDHLYTGKVAVQGRDIVVSAQRRDVAPTPDDLLTYYMKVFTVNGSSVQIYGDADIPAEFNAQAGYGWGRDTLEIAAGPSVFANIVGTTGNGNTMYTLGYEFSPANGGFEITTEVDMVQFNPDAGQGLHPNYGQPLVYDGGKLYIADPMDKSTPRSCRTPDGSVRVFDVFVDTNPVQVCSGAQDVEFGFAPVANATAYSWWSSGETNITSNGNRAEVDFGSSFSQGTINMGVQLSVAPYYVTYTATVSAAACDVDGGVSGNPWQCSGAQDFVYTTEPVASATSYNWWSPGAANIVANGPSATIDFLQSFSQTTVNVGINLNAPPYYVERSMVVSQMACGQL